MRLEVVYCRDQSSYGNCYNPSIYRCDQCSIYLCGDHKKHFDFDAGPDRCVRIEVDLCIKCARALEAVVALFLGDAETTLVKIGALLETKRAEDEARWN